MLADSDGAAEEDEILDVRYDHEGLSELEEAELEGDLADLSTVAGMSQSEEAEVGDLNAPSTFVDDPPGAGSQNRIPYLDSNQLPRHAHPQQQGAAVGRKLLR